MMLFHIPTDPVEKNDLSATNPAMVETLLKRIEFYRQSETLGCQWDTVPQSMNCDTGPTIGSNTASCQMRSDLYIEARTRKGCIDAYIPGAGAETIAETQVPAHLRSHIEMIGRLAGGSY
jgi:hypothetical protein